MDTILYYLFLEPPKALGIYYQNSPPNPLVGCGETTTGGVRCLAPGVRGK